MPAPLNLRTALMAFFALLLTTSLAVAISVLAATAADAQTNDTTLTITKEIVGPDDGTTFDFVGPLGEIVTLGAGESGDLTLGGTTILVTEFFPPGWTMDEVQCEGATIAFMGSFPGSNQAAFELVGAVGDVACTVTNSRYEPARLTLTKIVDGIDTGERFDFQVGSESASLSHGESATLNLIPGLSFIDEFLPAGWALSDVECTGANVDTVVSSAGNQFGFAQISGVESGSDVECIVTNVAVEVPTVTVTKEIDGEDDGSTFEFFSPTGSAILAGGETVTFNLDIGFNSIDEVMPPDWEMSHVVCDDDELPIFNALDGGLASFSLNDVQSGDAIECTVTNRRSQRPTLTVKKVVDGPDDGTVFEFLGPFGTVGGAAGGDTLDIPIPTGFVQIGELIPAGWTNDSIECNVPSLPFGGGDFAGASFENVTEGTNIECTFVNRMIEQPRVNVTKVIDGPDNGETFEFLAADGSSLTLGNNETGTVGGFAGETRVTELFPPGWTLSNVDCGDSPVTFFSDPFFGEGSFTVLDIAEGDVVDCVVTNAPFVPAQLTITKSVVGTDDGSQFTFFVGPEVATIGNGGSFTTTVAPGSVFVQELFPTGWEMVSVACNGEEISFFNLVPSAQFSLENVAAGDAVECVVENQISNRPTITVTKAVEGTDDGTRFQFSGPLNTSFAGNGETIVIPVETGVTTSISETLPPGWEGEVTCSEQRETVSDGPFVVVVFDGIEEGSNVDCTFTNRMVEAPIITITKVIDGPDNGETFAFSSQGGATTINLGNGQTGSLLGFAGSTIVFESLPPGWTLSDFVCSGDTTINVNRDGQNNVADISISGIENGDVLDCVATNTPFVPAQITVTKSVLGTDDGTQFPFFINGQVSTIGNGGAVTVDVSPGTVFVDETFPTGWEMVSATCNGEEIGIFNGETFAWFSLQNVAAGDVIDCVVENQVANRPTVTVTKVVDGPDDGTLFDFSGPLNNYVAGNGDTIVIPGRTDLTQISEVLPAGWEGEVTCSEPGDTFASGAIVGVAFPNLTGGANVDCTFTNRMVEPPIITITKVVDGPDNGEVFTFRSEDGTAITLGNGQSGSLPSFAGQAVIFEDLPPGWILDDVTCTDDRNVIVVNNEQANFAEVFISGVENGDVVDCVATNAPYMPASLTITKAVIGDDDGTVFTFQVDGSQISLVAGDSETIEIPPGDHFVDELLPPGWTLDAADCNRPTGSFSDPVQGLAFFDLLDVQPGDIIECTVTNRRAVPTSMNLTKAIDGADTGQVFTVSINGAAYAISGGQTVSAPIPPGTVFISESVIPGWILTDATCTGADVSYVDPTFGDIGINNIIEGSEIDCVITNAPVETASLTVTKVVDGTSDGTEFGFFVFGVDATFALADGQSVSIDVNPGTVEFEEVLPPGWDALSVDCGGVPTGVQIEDTFAFVSLEVGPGESAECVVTNISEDNTGPTPTATVLVPTVTPTPTGTVMPTPTFTPTPTVDLSTPTVIVATSTPSPTVTPNRPDYPSQPSTSTPVPIAATPTLLPTIPTPTLTALPTVASTPSPTATAEALPGGAAGTATATATVAIATPTPTPTSTSSFLAPIPATVTSTPAGSDLSAGASGSSAGAASGAGTSTTADASVFGFDPAGTVLSSGSGSASGASAVSGGSSTGAVPGQPSLAITGSSSTTPTIIALVALTTGLALLAIARRASRR